MSKKSKKERILRFGFILGGFLLLMNGVVAISQTKLLYGLIQILGSILNFGMLLNLKSVNYKQKLEDLIFVMNSVIALIVAFEYINLGGKYIQYVWIFTSILYIAVLVIKNRKTIPNIS